MSELLKQLKIKTSMLKRLRKQYESYTKQTKNINTKIQTLQQHQLASQSQDTLYEIKKNKQFLEESEMVLSNVKTKFIEAFEGLTNFLSQKSADQNIKGTQELTTAENLVLEVETFLETI